MTTKTSKTTSNEMTKAQMLETAARLTRQRKYRKQYNAGTYITDKSVVVINGVQYMRYKAGGVDKMRLVREGEDVEGLEAKTLS